MRFPLFCFTVACISTAFLFIAEYYSFVRIYRILFIYSLVDGYWVVSTLGLLWMLRTFRYKILCGHMFSFLLSIYLKVELLGHCHFLRHPFSVMSSLILTPWKALRWIIWDVSLPILGARKDVACIWSYICGGGTVHKDKLKVEFIAWFWNSAQQL